jgi:serine/threonine protein kinase
MEVVSCPGPLVWQQYALGLVEEDDLPALETHLASCPDCLEQLRRVPGEDALVVDLRSGLTAGTAPRDAVVEQVIRSATELGASQSAVGSADPSQAPTGSGLSTDATGLLFPSPGPDDLGRLGPFRVLRLLGRGGMGVVYQAEDTRLQRPVALKVLRPELASRPGAAARFRAEAQAMASLRHDHIVTVHQVDEVDGIVFLAMELLEGESLEARLWQGALPLAEVLRIGREAAEALAAAHDKELIHRDVKPDNIFLATVVQGSVKSYRVKLLDFGLVRAVHQEKGPTEPGMMLGTPAYLAPEQADGLEVDARADLFSLGVVLYRLCTGQLPFLGPTVLATLKAVAVSDPVPVRRLAPAVPEPLARLIERLLCKDPAGRPASANVVAETLAAIERHDPRAGKWLAPPRRFRWLALLVAAGLVAVVAVCLILLQLSRPHGNVGPKPEANGEALHQPEPDAAIVHVLRWEGDGEHIYKSYLSPDGRWVLGGSGFRGQVWEVASGKKVAELPGGVGAFSPDSQRLVVAVYPGSTAVYDLRWQAIHTIPVPFNPSTLGVSANGRFMIGGNMRDAVRVWDVETGTQRAVLDEKRGHWTALSADGRRAASIDSLGQELRLWDTGSGKQLQAWQPAVKEPRGVWFLLDGQVLLAGDQALTWWQEGKDAPVRRLILAKEKPASIGVSARAGLLVFGERGEKEVQVWSLVSGQELGRVALPYPTYGEAGVTPDGRLGSLAFSEQQRVIVFRLPAAAAAHAAREAGRAARPGK